MGPKQALAQSGEGPGMELRVVAKFATLVAAQGLIHAPP